MISKQLTRFSAKVDYSGKTLTTDKDNKIWMVSDPGMQSGFYERHVRVKAFVIWARRFFYIAAIRLVLSQRGGQRLGYGTVMVTVSEVRVRLGGTACTWKWTTTEVGGGGGGTFVPVEEVPPPPHDARNKTRIRESAGIGLAHPHCLV